MTLRMPIAWTSLALLGIVGITLAWSQQAGKWVLIEEPVEHDVYSAGREVEVRAPIGGDLVAAAQRVIVEATIAGDVLAAGKTVEIRAEVADDVRAAGQNVRVSAPVAGHVVAAGQSVIVTERIGDWAWLAGEHVEVAGRIGGELKAAAAQVTITGEILGDVDVLGETLNVAPGAVLHGNLRWRSDNEAQISTDARIAGEITHEPPSEMVKEEDVGGGLLFTASVMVAVAVLFLVFPVPLRRTADAIRRRPGVSLALGLALFAAIPIAIVLLLATGVGALLGIALLGVYLLLLLLGALAGIFAVSDIGLRAIRPQPSWWQVLLAIVVAVGLVALLSLVPILGFILVLAIWLFGVGALGLGFFAGYRELRAAGGPAPSK